MPYSLLFSFLFCIYSQDVKATMVDSLLRVLAQSTETADQVSIYHQLNAEFEDRNLDSAYYYALKALRLSQKTKNIEGTIISYYRIGNFYSIKGNYEKSEEYYMLGLTLSIKTDYKEQTANGYNNLGHVAINKTDNSTALEYYYKALKIEEELNNQLGIARVYNGIGNVMSKESLYNDALEYYFKSMRIRLALDDQKGLASSYNGIGVVYNRRGELDMAKDYFEKSLRIKESLGDLKGQAVSTKNLGSIYYLLKQYNKALTNYHKSLKIEKTLERKARLASSYFNLGISYHALNRNSLAKKYVDSSLKISREINYSKGEYQAYEAYSEIYESEGKMKEAFHFYKRYTHLRDSVRNEENLRTIVNLELEYNTDKQEKKNELLLVENDLLQSQNDMQFFQLKRNENLTIGLIIGFVFIVVIVLLLYRNRFLINRQKIAELDSKVLRTRINPHFLFNSLNSIQHFFLNHEEKKANQYLSDFSVLIRTILDSSSKTSSTLAEEISFLERYLSLEQARLKGKFVYDISVDADIDKGITLIPTLITQPFVENSIWHGIAPMSNPGSIKIVFKRAGDTIQCIIRDNGIGINESLKMKKGKKKLNEAMGIKITEERFQLFKLKSLRTQKVALIDLSEMGELSGTEVKFSIPLNIILNEAV